MVRGQPTSLISELAGAKLYELLVDSMVYPPTGSGTKEQ